MVVWLDMADPAATRQEFRASADREADSLIDVVDGLQKLDPKGNGIRASEIVKQCEFATNEALHFALIEVCAGRNGKLDAHAVGRKLASLRQRIIDGRMVDYHERRGRQRGWYVRRADGDKGDKGDVVFDHPLF